MANETNMPITSSSTPPALSQPMSRQAKHSERPLHLNPKGITRLRNLLYEANRDNADFETQYSHLWNVLDTILWRLRNDFGEQIECVMAVGDWVSYGIDLRNLPYDDVLIQIVLRSSERPFSLYQKIAQEVFTDLPDEDILVQFRLLTLQESQHAESFAKLKGNEESLGITLLNRL